jgi:hypothetical protein
MYVVCLECGKRFDYDWQEMRVLRKQEQHSPEPIWQLRERGAR